MGVVVAAHHLQLDTRVAIKFLLPAMLAAPEAVARFTREARAASKITSEHVARVRDVGTLETGAPYMVMEFLDGGDLAGWLQQRGKLDVGQAVDFVLQAGEAIAEAHSLGIVHRDLKPANLFCMQRADGLLSIKVLDFGISKVNDTAGGMSVTKTTAVMGSPLYMSPEQMTSSRDVDHRTDIWSLGVILFELITGVVPFTGEMFSEICVKIATQGPPPLRSLRPEAPEGLEAVINRCLEKDRSRRFGSIGELAQALAPFAPDGSRSNAVRIARVGSGADPRITGVSAGYPGQAFATSDAGLGRTTDPAGGRTTAALVASLAALGVAAIVGGVVVVARHGTEPQPAAAAAASQQSQVEAVAAAAPSSPPGNPPGAEVAAATSTAAPAPSAAAVVAVPATPPATPHGGGAAPGHQPAHGNTPAANPPAAAVAPAAAPAKHGVKPGCDPNYTLDANGEKHWKKECF
jgi:serine/threonine-protein kinase